MKVRDLLTDESKWCKHVFNGPNGSHCLVGAILVCYDHIAEKRLVIQHIFRYLGLSAIAGTSSSITVWNDNATFAEVRALVEELDI